MKVNAVLCLGLLLALSASMVTAMTFETVQNRVLSVLANTYPELQTAPSPWNANGTGGLLPFCTWTGITCNSYSQITKFSFVYDRDGFRLNGPFVQEWFNITTLSVLELRGQGFSGPMPSVIDNRAEYLKTLIISNNPGLNGTFPTTLNLIGDNVPYILNHVDFSKNDFEGPFPNIWLNPGTTAGYVYLSFVDFSYNRFSGTIVPNCTHTPSTVFLSHNELSGSLPSCHWAVSSNLDISYNSFSGAFPVMGTSYIDVSNNQFDDVSDFFAAPFITTVRTFNAFGNSISATPAPYSGFNFEYIDFSGNGMVGPFNDSWAAGTVEYLVAPNNQISSLWTPNSNLASLLALDISHNPISELPSGFEASATELLQLFATGCSFSGPVPAAITGLPSLQRLGIGHNAFTSDASSLTIASSTIQFLDLSYNALTGTILPVIRALTTNQPLKYLYIQGNSFTMCDSGSLSGSSLQFALPAVCLANQATSESVTAPCISAWAPCQLDATPVSAPSNSPVQVPDSGPSMPNPAEVTTPAESPSGVPSGSPSSSPSSNPSSSPSSSPSATPSTSGPSGSTTPSSNGVQISSSIFFLIFLTVGLIW